MRIRTEAMECNEWMNDVASKNCDCLFCLFARLHQFSRLRWAQHTFVIERKIIQTNKQWMAFGMCWRIYYDDFFRSAVFSLSHTPHPLISFFCVQHLVTLKIAERLLFFDLFSFKTQICRKFGKSTRFFCCAWCDNYNYEIANWFMSTVYVSFVLVSY